MKIWCNGSIVVSKGALDADDRGALLGDGLFETIAVVDSKPIALQRHLNRLTDGAKILNIPVATSLDGWARAIAEVLNENDTNEGSARITVLRGSGPRGVMPPTDPNPSLIVSAHSGEVGGAMPLRVTVATSTVRNERSPLSKVKSTNYLDAILARMEAGAAGADDAIMCNTCGVVAEATAANVFCEIDGKLLTPPISDGALPGIMRARVIEETGAIERSISRDDLSRAGEIFLTSSLNINPVIELNGNPVGTGDPGEIAIKLKCLPRRADTR